MPENQIFAQVFSEIGQLRKGDAVVFFDAFLALVLPRRVEFRAKLLFVAFRAALSADGGSTKAALPSTVIVFSTI